MATLRAPLLAQTPSAPLLADGSETRNALREDQLSADAMTQMGRGFESSRLGGEANYLASQEASLRAAGRHTEADGIRAQVDQLMARSNVFAPAEQDVTQLRWEPSRVGNWALGTMGQMGASMMDSMATGTAVGTAAKAIGLLPHPIAKAIGAGAGWLGTGAAAVPNVLQARGETYNDMVKDPELMRRTTDEQRNNAAWLSGGAQGVVDTAVPGIMINRILGKGFGKGVSAAGLMPRVGMDMAGSGAEEVAQEGMKKATLGYLNPERDTSGDANDYINSFAAGAVGVAPHSAGTIAIDNGFRRLGVKGDGEQGDEIDLATGETTSAPKGTPKKLFQDLGVSAENKYSRRQAAIDRALMLEQGTTEEDPEYTPEKMLGYGQARQAAILSDLASVGTPEAQALAEKVKAEPVTAASFSASPSMGEATNYLVKKLKLDSESISKRKLNMEADHDLNSGMKTLPVPLGGNYGGKGTVDIESQMLPSGSRKKMGEEAFKAAQTQVRQIKAATRLVADKMWRAYAPEQDASKANSAHREVIMGLAREVMAASTVDQATPGELKRAHRLADHLVTTFGPNASELAREIGRITGTQGLLGEVVGRIHNVVAMGDSGSLRAEATARDTAGHEIAKLLSPATERQLLMSHGIDMADAQDREHLLQVFEDFADGHSNIPLTKLYKTFGKETTTKMLEYVGKPIEPRLTSSEQMSRDNERDSARAGKETSEEDAAAALSSDDASSEERDTEDESNDEDGDAAFERKMLEKNFERLPPSTQVFHQHDGAPRELGKAFDRNERTKALPALLHSTEVSEKDVEAFNAIERDGAPKFAKGLLRGVDAKSPLHRLYGKMEAAADSAKNAPRLLTAKSLMDQAGIGAHRRVGLMIDYLKQTEYSKADELHAAVKSARYLSRVASDLAAAVQGQESLSPYGGKVRKGAVINHAALEKHGVVVPHRASKVEASKIVREALAKKEAEIMAFPGVKKVAAELHLKLKRAPNIADVADHYFDNRFVAVAQQDTNVDHLVLKHTEFTAMAKLGAARLKKAQEAGIGWTGGAKENAVQKAEAAANVIRFVSPYGTKKVKDESGASEVAIPTNELVKWVQTKRNAHTKDVNVRADTTSKSETAEAERYMRDLMEGITALGQQGYITKGERPYIINAWGKREEFSPSSDRKDWTEYTPDPDESDEWNDAQFERVMKERYGSLPPSLDLNGKTVGAHLATKAAGAARRRAATTPLRAERLNAVAKVREMGKDALHELEGEEANLALDRQAAEAAGSKRDAEERRHHHQQLSTFESAQDADVRGLTKANAYILGGKYGDSLWRSYMDGSVGRIMSVLRSLTQPDAAYDKETGELLRPARIYGEDSKRQSTAYLGGKHNVAALVGLVTPKRMALVKAEDKALFEGIRSQVAATLLKLPRVSDANKAKMINILSGYADAKTRDEAYALFIKKENHEAFLDKLAQAYLSERIQNEQALAESEKQIDELAIGPLQDTAREVEFTPVEQNADPKAVAEAKAWVEKWDRLQGLLDTTTTTAERAAAMADLKAMDEQVGEVHPLAQTQTVGGDKGAPLAAQNVRPVGKTREQEAADAKAAADEAAARDQHRANKAETNAENEKATFATLDQLAEETPPPLAPPKFRAKEQAKLKGAKYVLAPISAEQGFAGELARWAKSVGRLFAPKGAVMTHGAVVYVSVPGANRGWTGIKTLTERAIAAAERGFILRTDNQHHAERSHNLAGEGELRAALIAAGLHEHKGEMYSEWRSQEEGMRRAGKGERVQTAQAENLNDGQFDLSEEDLGNPDEGSFEDAAPRKLNSEVDVVALKKRVNSKRMLHKRIYESMQGRTENSPEAEAAVGEKMRKMAELNSEINELRRIIQKHEDAKRKASKPQKEAAQPKAPLKGVELNSETADAPTREKIAEARSYITRVLGPKVRAMFMEVFDAGGEWLDADQVVKIATANPLKIMQMAYHESMHGFFSNVLKHHPEARTMLEGVMSDPKMITRLEGLLKKYPEAVASMKADPEERVAYAYQFWAAGLLDIDQKPKTFFQKVQAFMRRVFGAVRDSEKALAIFESFKDGKLAEPSPAGKVISDIMAQGEWRKLVAERMDRQIEWANSMTAPAHEVMMKSESATVRKLAALWWANPADAEGAEAGPGVLNRRAEMDKKYNNHLWAIISKLSDRDLQDLSEALNKETPDADIAQESVVKARAQIYKLNEHFYKYLKTAGVSMGVRDAKKYYPVIWNLEHLINNKQQFIDMLKREYPHMLVKFIEAADGSGERVSPDDVAAAIHQSIVDRGGETEGIEAHREDGVLNPYFAASNTRSFDWIRKEHSGEFLDHDVVSTMTRYLSQGVRSAEYVRSFDKGGQVLKDAMARAGDVQRWERADGAPVRDERDLKGVKVRAVTYQEDGPVITELNAEADKLKLEGQKKTDWVNRRVEDIQRSMGAMEGVLGKNITAGQRKFNSAVMVYQNLRLLPLSIFAAMLDPNGIKVAGGEWDDMFQAYMRGMRDVLHTWKDVILGDELGHRGQDVDETNAMIAGTIDSTMYLENRGEAHTSEYTSGTARKINHALFLGNGLSAWDRAMRITATKAAMKFIARHNGNANKEHSARWMKDLGLEQGSVELDANGMPFIDRVVLANHRAAVNGTTRAEEQAKADADTQAVHTAINRWVARAVLSPNAAQRPAWSSDPHYAPLFHLKQFTYSFQHTTMKYAMNEAAHGNNAALAQLTMGIPIMIAADVAKALLTGGGSLPGYMQSWNFGDWVGHAWNRAGLNGTKQFGLDLLTNPASLPGPMFNQVIDAATHPLGDTISSAIPGVRYLHLDKADMVKDLAD